tara:strand:- start:793 stop:1215 length:423 start_codon:yes stop_codon:yes gene_type:complete
MEVAQLLVQIGFLFALITATLQRFILRRVSQTYHRVAHTTLVLILVLGLLDQLVPLVPLVPQGRKDHRVFRAFKATQDRLDLLALHLLFPALLGQLDLLVVLGQQAQLDPLVPQDRPDPLQVLQLKSFTTTLALPQVLQI